MPHTIEKTVFKFDELDECAKEKARDWWRQGESCDMDLLDRYDIEEIAKILGIEFDKRQVPLMNGKTRGESKIYYSGFCSQGDGACFEGRYNYAKGCAKEIRKYAPQDTRLHSIADQLAALQKKHFYRVSASTSHRGHHYHSGCMSVDTYLDGVDAPHNVAEDMRDILREFADWIYRQLESEYEYRMSDENVDESIRINDYSFDEHGNID